MKIVAARFAMALSALSAEAAPAPVVFQSAPGRFEITASDAVAAQTITQAAADAWRWLGPLLGLPEAFSSRVFVRQVPVADWREPEPFRTIVEPGGVVSLRIGWNEGAPLAVLRRALVQSLLLRLAVAQHGVNERLTVPLWLEHGCVRKWETSAEAAQLDHLRQVSARIEPPALKDLLGWERGGEETVAHSMGGLWLLVFLQAESSAGLAEWRMFLRRCLSGEPALEALSASYPGRFSSPDERELWWRTGFHHVRRARTLPTFESGESRVALEALVRFVAASEERDVIVPFATVLAHGREPFVAAELQRRATELGRILPVLHPFYRNAGLSLAEAFAARLEENAMREQALRAFERDWGEATELERATAAALDALENRLRPWPGG